MDSVVIKRMRKFAAMNKLKKAALLVVARSMSPEQIQGLKQLFHMIDADDSGTITVEELKTALHDMGNIVTVRAY
jgi:calcium-dependent protein kinase